MYYHQPKQFTSEVTTITRQMCNAILKKKKYVDGNVKIIMIWSITMFLISIRLMILEEYESKPCHQVQKLAAHVSSRLSNVWENYRYPLELIWCFSKKLHRWMIKSYLKNSGPHSQLVALDMQCLVTTDIKDTEMDYISMDNDNQRDPCE